MKLNKIIAKMIKYKIIYKINMFKRVKMMMEFNLMMMINMVMAVILFFMIILHKFNKNLKKTRKNMINFIVLKLLVQHVFFLMEKNQLKENIKKINVKEKIQ